MLPPTLPSIKIVMDCLLLKTSAVLQQKGVHSVMPCAPCFCLVVWCCTLTATAKFAIAKLVQFAYNRFVRLCGFAKGVCFVAVVQSIQLRFCAKVLCFAVEGVQSVVYHFKFGVAGRHGNGLQLRAAAKRSIRPSS